MKKNPLIELQKKRLECLQHELPESIKLNLMQPFPDNNTPFQELSFLAVDFETTGFEAEANDIISIGWMEISNMQIDFATQKHLYINNDKQINHETVVINHIVPQMVCYGVTLEDAVNTLLQYSKGKILLVHGKIIEKSFLDHYAQNSLGLSELPLLWVDTLSIEQWRANETGKSLGQDNRLSSVRKRYCLPRYSAHNALIDSVSAAELLLAQVAHIYKNRKVTFERLYKISQ